MTFDTAYWRREAKTLRKDLIAAGKDSYGRRVGEKVVYGELNDRLWALLKVANITVVPTDNVGWIKACNVRPNEPSWYRSASLEDVAMASTHLQRGERFCDGWWLSALQNGVIFELIERLELLADELPYDPAQSPWTNRNYL